MDHAHCYLLFQQDFATSQPSILAWQGRKLHSITIAHLQSLRTPTDITAIQESITCFCNYLAVESFTYFDQLMTITVIDLVASSDVLTSIR